MSRGTTSAAHGALGRGPTPGSTYVPSPRSGRGRAADWPSGLEEAFLAYEKALAGNDLELLDQLVAPGKQTLRGDADGLLVGRGRIAELLGGRGGAPARRIVSTEVRAVDEDHALVVAVTELERGGRGLQTQLWERLDARWVVTAAHVSAPAPALDTRVWRVLGDPLLPGTGPGPLVGETVAVKDLYAVAGQRVGAGNPAWLAQAPVEERHAWTVQRLVDDGAAVAGIARTDELAYSLAGTNAHHGTPPNPKAPYRVSGGSSSGSASAVSLGHVTIGLGTDTGGSIRVPASYQGLWGIRTTHGAVPVEGVLPLAPSFDTVGWLTRDAALLRKVGETLLRPDTGAEGAATELLVVPALLDLADADVRGTVGRWARRHEATVEDWRPEALDRWLVDFQRLQAWEAWASHGEWLAGRLDTLGADVRGRFEMASRITAGAAEEARGGVLRAREVLRDVVGDRVLVLPSAASVAPRMGPSLAHRLQSVRDATMRLTCLAGLGGLPAVSVPLLTPDRLPCGASLVAGAGRDRDLLRLAEELAEELDERTG